MPQRTNWYLITKDRVLQEGKLIFESPDGINGTIYGIHKIEFPTITLIPIQSQNETGQTPIFDQTLTSREDNEEFRLTCYMLEVESDASSFIDLDSQTAMKIANRLRDDKNESDV